MRNPLDRALAALCEATREAVAELEAESDGFFDGCPLCGKPSWMHPAELSAPPATGESA